MPHRSVGLPSSRLSQACMPHSSPFVASPLSCLALPLQINFLCTICQEPIDSGMSAAHVNENWPSCNSGQTAKGCALAWQAVRYQWTSRLQQHEVCLSSGQWGDAPMILPLCVPCA